jgi:methionyl-tRNA synthetase
MINIDDFAKVEMKVGTILEVEAVEGSDKLWKLKVDLGLKTDKTQIIVSDESSQSHSKNNEEFDTPSSGKDIRQVLSGIKQYYSKEELIGRQAVFVANLAPRQMMGLESEAMIMAVDGENKPILLAPSEKVADGANVR